MLVWSLPCWPVVSFSSGTVFLLTPVLENCWGLMGIFLGVLLAVLVSKFADIPTEISFISIVLSFAVAAIVGLLFGITPAKRAAEQNPITSLRHE